MVWSLSGCGGEWYVTEVVNHCASSDPAAPKYVTSAEIRDSLLAGQVFAEAWSKAEALLKYAATGCGREIWSLCGGVEVELRPAGLYELKRIFQ